MPDYIGASAPVQRVEIRPGVLVRDYTFIGTLNARTPMMAAFPMHAHVGDSAKNPEYPNAWTPTWTPLGAYVDLPSILQVKLGEKTLTTNGIDIASIDVENIAYPDQGGWFKRERGAFSALRGNNYGSFALLDENGTPVTANEWSGRIVYGWQITVWQGWGEASSKTFTGLIEETDDTSHPDRITVTARSFGQILSDTNALPPATDPYIPEQITFADEKEASTVTPSGYNAHASSNDEDAEKVTDGDDGTAWESIPITTPASTVYVEVAITEGKYQDFSAYIPAGFEGMNMYVSLRAAPATSGGEEHIVREGEELIGTGKIDGEDWVDLGLGDVPGETVPYISLYENIGDDTTLILPLDGESFDYTVGSNSVLRLSFTNLANVAPGKYAAAVGTLNGRRLELKGGEEGIAVKNHWVLVNDISDVVKLLCAWAGFKEWEIEDTGAALPTGIGGELGKRLVVDETQSFMDVIKILEKGVGFSFFVKAPSADEDSLGIPCWRRTRTVMALGESAWESGGQEAWAAAATVTDSTLVTAIEVKRSSEELRDAIRVFGRGNEGKRLRYIFFPPWSGAPSGTSKLAGVLKQLSHKDDYLTTIQQCQYVAFLIALQEALESIEGTVEVPGFPFELEEHVIVLDLGTGLSTRLAINGASSVMTSGEKAKWTSSLKGHLIDTPDVADMVAIINSGGEGAEGNSGEWGVGDGEPTSEGYG